jgi:hypothetical protein
MMATAGSAGQLHIFLLAGQSNMAGRGRLAQPPEQPAHPNILVFRSADGRAAWEPAAHPLHRDKPAAGCGPGLAFARCALDFLGADAAIGLVPAAVGGSAIARWHPQTGDLFRAAVDASHAAQASALASTGRRPAFAGILWHQGESDAVSVELADAYGAALRSLIAELPRACAPPPLPPLVVGELGLHFLEVRRDADAPDGAPAGRFAHAPRVNGAICAEAARAAATGQPVGVVSARGLAHCGDRLHFGAEAAEQLGARYALRWLQLAGRAHASLSALCSLGALDPPLLVAETTDPQSVVAVAAQSGVAELS